MFLARVTGSIVATQKVASMIGSKLLTVEPLRVDPQQRDRLVSTGRTFVVVDTVGAGLDETVLIVQGSSARMTPLCVRTRCLVSSTAQGNSLMTPEGGMGILSIPSSKATGRLSSPRRAHCADRSDDRRAPAIALARG